MLVRDVMREPACVQAEETLDAAARTFKKENVGALPVCRDSDDQKFLELARDCEADYLVSKDRQLLILSARRRPLLPFDVVTPRRLNDVLVSMA